MKLRTRLGWTEIRNHLQYTGWLYLLVFALAFGLTNLVYAQTAYRPPQHKRVDLYIQSASTSQETVNAFLEPIWREAAPDMESVSAVLLMAAGNENDYYANMQLMTYIAAGEGDIYMLSSTDFKRFASQGAFIPLEEAIAQGRLDATGLDLAPGRVSLVDVDEKGNPVVLGEPRQFGVPAKDLYRFATELSIDNRDLVLAISANSGNEDGSLAILNALIQRTRGEMPESFKQ